MTRRYDDPVEVRRRDDEPAQFLWRGRLYVVRGVLGQWVETTAWWRGPAARAALSLDQPEHPPATRAALSLDQPEHPAANPVGTAVAEGAEREVWRVEASAGRARGSGVYDLCFDWAAGSWTLLRALD